MSLRVGRSRVGWRALLMVLAATAALTRVAPAQETPTDPLATALTAARSFWSTLDSTWRERDAPAFTELFTEDASFAFVDRGVTLEPRTMIARQFTEQFARQAPDLRHVTEVRAARVIAPGVLAVDVGIEVRRVSGDSAEPPTILRRFAAFAVMRRTGDRWQVELLRAYLLPTIPTVGDLDGDDGS